MFSLKQYKNSAPHTQIIILCKFMFNWIVEFYTLLRMPSVPVNFSLYKCKVLFTHDKYTRRINIFQFFTLYLYYCKTSLNKLIKSSSTNKMFKSLKVCSIVLVWSFSDERAKYFQRRNFPVILRIPNTLLSTLRIAK